MSIIDQSDKLTGNESNLLLFNCETKDMRLADVSFLSCHSLFPAVISTSIEEVQRHFASLHRHTRTDTPPQN